MVDDGDYLEGESTTRPEQAEAPVSGGDTPSAYYRTPGGGIQPRPDSPTSSRFGDDDLGFGQ